MAISSVPSSSLLFFPRTFLKYATSLQQERYVVAFSAPSSLVFILIFFRGSRMRLLSPSFSPSSPRPRYQKNHLDPSPPPFPPAPPDNFPYPYAFSGSCSRISLCLEPQPSTPPVYLSPCPPVSFKTIPGNFFFDYFPAAPARLIVPRKAPARLFP